MITPDIYIPGSAIASIEEDGIFLNIPKDQVKRMGWDTPPVAEASTAGYDTTFTATSYATTGTVDRDTAYVDRDATYAETPGARAATELQGTTQPTDEATIPVVEEELRIGKRAVEQGGVRVNVDVDETPVEEQVNLREERVRVDRR